MRKYISFTLSVLILLCTVCSMFCVSAAEDSGMTFSDDCYYQSAAVYDKEILTFEAEIKLPVEYASNNKLGGIILGSSNADAGYTKGYYNFQINTNGYPALVTSNTNTARYDYLFKNVQVATGDWVHLAIVKDTENGLMKCYLNGVYKQSIKLSDNPFPIPTVPYVLGSDYSCLNDSSIDSSKGSGDYNQFMGEIRSVKTYSDARTKEEINSDMSSLDTDNLISYYELSSADTTAKTILDKSGNGYDMNRVDFWLDEAPALEDYDFSMAIIGDHQKITGYYPDQLHYIYDDILEFESDSANKLEYVINLGDFTEWDGDEEHELFKSQLQRLDGVVPYSFIRGNHESEAQINKFYTTEEFADEITGSYNNSMLNTYREINIGGIDYLIVTTNYYPNDAEFAWANEVISNHPDHNVIVVTHGYLLGNLERAPITYCSSNGPDMWEKLLSQHSNIVLALCGHSYTNPVVYRQDRGVNGNTVTQMLINPQDLDFYAYNTGLEQPYGLVAYLYFSNEGRDVQVRYYSTILDKWFRSDSQFSLSLDMAHDNHLTDADFGALDVEAQDTEQNLVGKAMELIAVDKTVMTLAITFISLVLVGGVAIICLKKKKQ